MILIDYSERRPIYEQVAEKIAELIIRGVLPPESQLPSVRSLAMDLSINPNTIQRAYQELERKGYTYSVPGKGSFVSQKTEYPGRTAGACRKGHAPGDGSAASEKRDRSV